MEYYFQPTGQAYSKAQIQGLVGINPETADDEVLNYYGIFRIVPWKEEFDSFSVAESRYEVRNSFAYQIPSSQAIPLEEAKEKARQIVSECAHNELCVLEGNSGFSEKLLFAIFLCDLPYFSTLKEGVGGVVTKLKEKLELIESATDEQQLREICSEG